MHHLDGTVRGININNQLKGSEYVLVTVADYTVSDMWGEPFVESYLQEYMDTRRSGEAGYLYVFLRIWLSTGLLAMLVFLAVFLAVGGFRYMKAKSAYDMKCYRIETTNAMAHDLKTPLTAISGYAENLLSQVQVDKREYYAKAILSNIEYMDQMIHDILELSKSEDGRQDVELTQVVLHDFIGEELVNYKLLVAERGLTVTITGEQTIRSDRRLLKSMVDNLLSNAVKYAAPLSEVRIVIKGGGVLTHGTDETGKQLPPDSGTDIRKTKRNQRGNGIGGWIIITNQLSAPIGKTAEELIKPYVKGDNSRGNREGSGVGLAIVENVAGQLKYKVSYEITDEEFSVQVKL